jgi:DNA-binding transcriptional MerR regulator
VDESDELSLTEAARILGVRQHRLIYLCERGVVFPDRGRAKGRGSSRRFSRRNLLDFSIALRLRGAMVPMALAAAFVRVLRFFESKVSAEIAGFRLPEGLTLPSSPSLRAFVVEGQRLFFAIVGSGEAGKVFGPVDLRKVGRSRRPDFPLTRSQSINGAAAVKIEIDVSAICRALAARD